MPLTLSKEAEKRCIESIREFFAEHMEEGIGDLKAALVLDFCLKEICPTVYNQAISDAQTYVSDKAAEMDGSCYQPEFGYWGR